MTMSLEYGFVFSSENCIECRACEVACKTWRGQELGVHWRRVRRAWEGQYPNVSMKSVSVSCMHCVDPACVKACPEEAITKGPDGIVSVDRQKCIGCKACLEACDYGAPQFGEKEAMQKCDICVGRLDLKNDLPPCAATCPTKALTVKKLSPTDKLKQEKEIKSCLPDSNNARLPHSWKPWS